MTWDTNWVSSEGKGKLLKTGLNNLRAAFSERYEAATGGGSLPAAIYQITTGRLIDSTWFSSFHSSMTAIIANYYLNHSTEGTWEGNLTSLPFWTEADILTFIGDASRIPAPTDPLICAAWMYQQYKLINALRWTVEVGGSAGSVDKKEGISLISAADALTQYNADSWSSDSIADFQVYSIRQSSLSVAPQWNLVNKRRYRDLTTYSTSLKPSIDMWFIVQASGGGAFYSPEGWTENKIAKLASVGEQTWDGTPYSILIEIAIAPKYAPLSNYATEAYTPSSGATVLKWDGANGFIYRDW